MTDDRQDSLADQAATWVPPWARPRTGPAAEDAVEAGPTTAEPGDEAGEPVADDLEPVPALGPTPAPDPELPLEPAPAPAPEPTIAPDLGREPAPADRRVGGRPDAVAGAGRVPGALDTDELRGALEAILLVVDEPVTELVLAQVLEQPVERVAALLEAISADYTAAGHGFDLRRAAGGWRLYTRPEYATYVERFILDGQSVRLTQAALETLAVVAYKQPVTRSRISAIRGVNCDGTIRTLVSRGLVEECGSEPDSGAFLYRTTTMFLEKLGLNSADELPPLAPFLPDDLEEIADAPR